MTGISRKHCAIGMLVVLLLAGCGAREPGSVAPADMPDPTSLERTGRPNDWLICPESACMAEASARPRVYPVPPDRLFAAWQAVLAAQPRAEIIALDAGRGLLLAQDRTPVFRFVDTVAIRVLPTPGGSTFAAHSKSEIGFGDFGTNHRRLEDWTEALDAATAARP